MPTEQESLESEEQEKLFVLLLEYTDMFALCNELAEQMYFNMRFIPEMQVKNYTGHY